MNTAPSSLQYSVDEDGLAVVDQDIVLGEAQDGQAPQGQAQLPQLNLWPGGAVPFFIQADVQHQERVLEAIEMFAGTGVKFHRSQGHEEDMLVFQAANEGCKSYVGRIGGKQPLWIGPQCGSVEIAHEIMHALGFIHEQNRSDRNNFVSIQWNDIEESSKINFELFPTSLMKASGSGKFDFQSLMLYPPTMWSKNGSPTMLSVDPRNQIAPQRSLSQGDRTRLYALYGQ